MVVLILGWVLAAIKLNKIEFGLNPTLQQIVCNPSISAGGSGHCEVELVVTPAMLIPFPPRQTAMPQ
eukprot:11466584-Ditylum_brightwellii.AAC.1